MQSTSDTSNQSSSVAAAKNGAAAAQEIPRCLTTAAIKSIQDLTDQKHISGLDYIVQITRIRDVNEGKSAAAKDKSADKKKAMNLRYK